MKLDKAKILLASDGEKTMIIINGVPTNCTAFTFSAVGGEPVKYSVEGVNTSLGFTEKEFMDFVENTLGYKLRNE